MTTSNEYPIAVKKAGILSIVSGFLILLVYVLVTFASVTRMIGSDRNWSDPRVWIGLSVVTVCATVAVVLICLAVRSLRGSARGTLGYGIGSIVFGLLNAAEGLRGVLAGLQGRIGVLELLVVLILSLSGLGFFTAGVLALVGRNDYGAWRQTTGRL